jgi:hypothetical protein
MNDHRKPRHIRDIAHLYISRMPARINRHLVWVTAASRDCFSAYHAANLALGIARRGHVVELVEASGILPCTAYFLRLPPRVYIKHKTQCPEEPLSALGGITVKFSVEQHEAFQDVSASEFAAGGPPRSRDASQPLSQSYPSSRDASQPLSQSYPSSRDASQPLSQSYPSSRDASQPRKSRSRIELIHLPPASDLESLQASMTRAQIIAGDDRVHALVLAADNSQARDVGHRLFSAIPGIQWSTLSLERRASTNDRPGDSGRNLGYLVGWRQLLSDPVPCVLRDPDSHVSRSYLSIGDVLVSAANTAKERNDRNPRSRSASLGQSG